jgi:hypothetical protein
MCFVVNQWKKRPQKNRSFYKKREEWGTLKFAATRTLNVGVICPRPWCIILRKTQNA